MKDKLYFLTYENDPAMFIGYGIDVAGDGNELVGNLIIDKPRIKSDGYLRCIEAVFGKYNIFSATKKGERCVTCRMNVDDESSYLVKSAEEIYEDGSDEIEISKYLSSALKEHYLPKNPSPHFRLSWSPKHDLWLIGFIMNEERDERLRSFLRGCCFKR